MKGLILLASATAILLSGILVLAISTQRDAAAANSPSNGSLEQIVAIPGAIPVTPTIKYGHLDAGVCVPTGPDKFPVGWCPAGQGMFVIPDPRVTDNSVISITLGESDHLNY